MHLNIYRQTIPKVTRHRHQIVQGHNYKYNAGYNASQISMIPFRVQLVPQNKPPIFLGNAIFL